MKNYKDYQIILILTPFVFSFAFGLDAYIPVIPQMTKIFDTTPALVHLTLSLFLFVTGVGQLFIGPLSDAWGRKKTFYSSAILFALGSIGSSLCPTIGWLIFSRVVCSIGACGMLVTAFALVRDLYDSDKSAKIYSFLNGAVGISPTFAPIIGGYLASYFGWQSVFYLLTGIGLFALLVTKRFIVETLPQEKRVNMGWSLVGRYKEIVSNKQFMTYTLISGFAETVFFGFFSISPFIIIDVHGIPTHEFGYYFAVFGSVIATGGFSAGKLTEKFGVPFTIGLGITLMFLGGISMVVWQTFFEASLSGFLIPMAIACTGAIYLVGCSASKALEPFGKMAGTASAAFGALEFGIAALAGSILMLFPTYTPIPYGLVVILMGILSLSLFMTTWEKRARLPQEIE